MEPDLILDYESDSEKGKHLKLNLVCSSAAKTQMLLLTLMTRSTELTRSTSQACAQII